MKQRLLETKACCLYHVVDIEGVHAEQNADATKPNDR